MASGGKIVKLSHLKLKTIAAQYEESPGNENNSINKGTETKDREKKYSKRPDRQIYQPGRLRQSRTSEGDVVDNVHTDNDRNTESDEITNLTQALKETAIEKPQSNSQTEEKQTKKRQKRPDIALYVPKGRLHKQSDGASAGRAVRTSPGPGSKYGSNRYGGGEEMHVTVVNERISPNRHDDPSTLVVNNRKGRYTQQRWNRGGPSNRRRRKRSSDSVGSVEFLDDGLEWDYQVDIDVEPKGEHGEGDFDFGGSFNEDDDILSHDITHDLPEYEGLPPQCPIQHLLGPDTYQTLQDLEISFSAEEHSDEERESQQRKKRVRRKHTPYSQDRMDKSQKTDSPREIDEKTEDKQIHAKYKQDELANRVVTDINDAEKTASLKVTLQSGNKSSDSPKEQRKQRSRDNREKHINKKISKDEERTKQTVQTESSDNGAMIKQNNVKKSGNTNRKQQQDTRLKGKGRNSSQQSDIHEKHNDDQPKMQWGDMVELGNDEMEYEHIDLGSESSQSSSTVKINTPDTEKPSPRFEEECKKMSHKNETQRNVSKDRGRGKGRGRGQHNQSTGRGQHNQSTGRPGIKQGCKSPVKETNRSENDKQNNSQDSNTESTGSNVLPKKPPVVTEYEMDGDNFSGLVVTNSLYNNRKERRRHVSGDNIDKRDSPSKSGKRRGSVDNNISNTRDRNSSDTHNKREWNDKSDRYNKKIDHGYNDDRKALWNDKGHTQSSDSRRDTSSRNTPPRDNHYNRNFENDSTNSGRGERYRTTSHSSNESAPTAKGGGILHLPASSTALSGTTTKQTDTQSKAPELTSKHSFPNLPHGQQHNHYHQQQQNISKNRQSDNNEYSRGTRGRGRGGSHRTLYDPNNPQPQQTQQQQQLQVNTAPRNQSPTSSHNKPLHFYDSSEDSPPHQPYPGPRFMVAPYMTPSPNRPGFIPQHSGMRMPLPMMMPRFAAPPGFFRPPGFYGEMQHPNYQMMGEDYYQGYNGAENSRGKSKSASRDKAESILPEVLKLEAQLNNLLARRINGMEDFIRIISLKKEYQGKCVEVLMIDPETANHQAIEQSLWKNAFYQVIEVIKRQMSSGDTWEPDMLRQSLMGVLDEGNIFYEKLLNDLQSEFKFKLTEYYDPLTPYPNNLGRSSKLALYSAHIFLLCLGDLARYREQIMQSTNYGKARSWYIKAQQVMPKNGRSYNQLAILAMYTKRKLEAVYYFMRSLAASNPFLNGREILMSIFDEIRKKAEVIEKKKIAEKERQRNKKPKAHTQHGHRIEIWINADGTSCEDLIDEENDENELSNLSTHDLNKRFTLSFLNVHGKLFTKIGWDHFPEISSQMLHEFKALLQHTPCPLSMTRLLQLVTMNMFAVHNSVPKDDSHMDENCRPLVQEYAVQLGLDMYALIADRCKQLLKEHQEEDDPQVFSEAVRDLMPSIVMWTNWMTIRQDLWNPPPLSRDPELGPIIDVWQNTEDLLKQLNTIDTSAIKLYRQHSNGYEPLVLDEGSQMAGFTPLTLFDEEDRYVDKTTEKAMARDFLRIDRFKMFTEFLAGIEPPLLKWNAEKHVYEAVIKDSDENGRDERESRKQLESESDDVVVESESEDEFNTSGETEEITKLKAKKEELTRKMELKTRHEENIKAVLKDTQTDRQMAIEVCPLFLVPDTNCFIDHLKGIRRLVFSKKYTIVIPLVVINELDGLSKGSKEGQYDSFEHAEKVKQQALATIDFLEKEFDQQNNHLKAMTSRGHILKNISYRSEDVEHEGNNDDVILSCCLSYTDDKARNFMPKSRDGMITLTRQVVLITDDRNLRLKAHTRNVPVKDLPHFLRWAKIT